MSKTVFSTFNKSDNVLSVSLISSNFTKNGEMIGKVSRNTATLENMISDIIDENRGIDPYMINHSAILLQQQIIKNLKAGKAVNVLDLGILYIGIKGTIKGKTPDEAVISDFDIRFTPSSLAQDTVKDLQVDKFVLSDSNPHISSVINGLSKQANILTPNILCCITGSRLKLGGDTYSISLVPLDEDGNESKLLPPVVISSDRIYSNTSKCVEFFVPKDIDANQKYVIKVTTSFLGYNQSRKTPVSAVSEVVTIEG